MDLLTYLSLSFITHNVKKPASLSTVPKLMVSPLKTSVMDLSIALPKLQEATVSLPMSRSVSACATLAPQNTFTSDILTSIVGAVTTTSCGLSGVGGAGVTTSFSSLLHDVNKGTARARVRAMEVSWRSRDFQVIGIRMIYY